MLSDIIINTGMNAHPSVYVHGDAHSYRILNSTTGEENMSFGIRNSSLATSRSLVQFGLHFHKAPLREGAEGSQFVAVGVA